MQRRQTLAVSTLIAVVSTLFFTGLSVVTFRQVADAPFTSQPHSWLERAGDGTLLMDGMITLTAKRVVYECTTLSVNYTCTIDCGTGLPMNLTIYGVNAWVVAEDGLGGSNVVGSAWDMWTSPLEYENVDSVVFSGTTELLSHYSGGLPFPISHGAITLYLEASFESSRYHWGGSIVGPGEFTPVLFARTLQHPATWVTISVTTIGSIGLALVIYVLTLRSRKLAKAIK